MENKKKRRNDKGFSLVELIIVIAIMAVLIGVLAPTYLGYVDRSRQATDVQNAQQIATEIGTRIADGEISGNALTMANYAEVTTAVISAVPNVRNTDAGNRFYYRIVDNNDTVTVHVAVETAGDDVTDADDLFPTFINTGEYDRINN